MCDQTKSPQGENSARLRDWYSALSTSKTALANPNSNESKDLDAILKRVSESYLDIDPMISNSHHHYHTDQIKLLAAQSHVHGTSSPKSVDKPLPAVPGPFGDLPPYFDYIFANAHLTPSINGKGGKNNGGAASPRPQSLVSASGVWTEGRSMMVEDLAYNDSPSPEVSSPRTPVCRPTIVLNPDPSNYASIVDGAGFVEWDALQAGIEISTKDISENYAMFHGTNLQGNALDLEVNDVVERSDATTGFYGGFVAEESPSPYHAPNVGNGTGFGDIRDGAEAFPEQWVNQERPLSAYEFGAGLTYSQEEIEELEKQKVPPKRVLMPKSQKAKAAKNNLLYPEYPEITYIGQVAPSMDLPLIFKKRGVGSLFNVDEMVDTSNDYEYEVQQMYPKRTRLSSDASAMDEDVVYAPMPSPCTTSGEEERFRSRSASITTTEVLAKREEFSSTEDGFPGQFIALELPERGFHPKFLAYTTMKTKQKFVMGDPLHPNNVFIHHKFRRCANEYSLDYNKVDAHPDSEAGRTLKKAEKLAIAAAEVARTRLEENLRREAHLECTLARLEGVVVGQFRYYQGHSNIEEYKDGGMCICWEDCMCAKICTLFADMCCPCSEHIEVCEV